MPKLVDGTDLKSVGKSRAGSSPAERTIDPLEMMVRCDYYRWLWEQNHK